jgi:ATP-dependent RNA helicase RhlE
VIFGGVGQGNQVRAIDRGVDILVATPGRLLDLIGQGYIDLGKVEILILDEADQMLDMGFIHDLRKIVKRCPRERQTLMFSATMPPEIRKLTREWLNKPFELHVAPVASTPNLVSQSIYFVEKKQKLSALVHFLKETPRSRTLVFSRTKWGADRIAKALNREGIKSTAIHGNKSQNRRQAAIKEFKSEEPPVLVATDIAARGLDFDDISHVINYDLPDTPETYVHRIGRTARAGASGAAVSFCDSDERKLVRGIERLTGCKIAAKNMPQFAELKPASDGGRSRGGGNQNSRSRNGSGARGQGNGERGGNENRGKKKPTKRRRFKAKDRSDSRDDSTRSEESSTQTKPAKKKTKKKVSEQKRTFKKRDNDSNGNDSSQGEGKVTAKKVKKTGTVKSTVKKKSSFKKGGKKHFGNSSGNSPKGNAGDHNTR